MSDKTHKIQIDIWNKYKNETKESLLEIISNQDKEIERLQLEAQKYYDKMIDQQQIIDKALNYIEEYKASGMREEWFKSSTPISYLKNTLKGIPTPEETLKGESK